jgi:hypothetical protein
VRLAGLTIAAMLLAYASYCQIPWDLAFGLSLVLLLLGGMVVEYRRGWMKH